ncbi:hypothetical protein [Brachybacterium tyrofermentans]|uniref:hypothetical protein n=1 Tax=Brachybacterium TaxID=43668 RepID=UPI003D1CA571
MTTPTPREVPVSLHGAVLDQDGPWRRSAPRPLTSRQEFYEERFDARTLFYDVFRVRNHLEFIGPPLLDLEGGLKPLELAHGRTDYAGRFRSTAKNRLHRHRVSPVPRSVGSLSLRCPLGTFQLEIGENLSSSFTGRRVLVTQSRNNPLEWIARWVDHHITVQGIDAVVLYDNGSTRYTPDELREVLCGCHGLEVFSVIEWPYPWGPTGGPDAVWDSDYGQHGAWEHAWRRLGLAAATLTFGDVDELIVGPPPSVTDRALSAKDGISSYRRRAVLNVPTAPTSGLSRIRDYVDYRLFAPAAPLLSPKYTVVPGRLRERDQLMVHRVAGRRSEDEGDVLARHFDGIRIEWRDGDQHPVLDLLPEELEGTELAVDEELVSDLARLDPHALEPHAHNLDT